MTPDVEKTNHGATRGWTWASVLLFVAAFGPTLVELVGEWIDRPEYSHGFLMVPVAIWLAKERWPSWDRVTETAFAGLWLLLPGVALLLLGEMKLSWFLKPIGFYLGLAGLVWSVFGFRTLRHFGAVFVPLILMYPLPGRIERSLTVPLKQYAAYLSTGMLDLTGISATLDGNIISIPGYGPLAVADACSGIRSLISLLSIGVLACVFWPTRVWVKALVLMAAVPVALFVNALRIWVTGLLSYWGHAELAQGMVHDIEGLVMFAIAASILGGWAYLVQLIAKEISPA